MVHSSKLQTLFPFFPGGYDRKARKFSASETSQRSSSLDGYVLDGFHENGPGSLDLDLSPVIDILANDVYPHLRDGGGENASEKPRLFHGSCDPAMVFRLVSEAGVDMFDASYVYHVTEEGKALVFENRFDEVIVSNGNGSPKKAKKDFALNLKDPRFKEDFTPLSDRCSCYTCEKHTRGYVNHLLSTNELLGPVLLSLHNLHHYQVFFESLRKAVESKRLEEFKKVVLN